MDPSFGAVLEFVLALGRLTVWLPTWVARRMRGDRTDQWTVGVIRFGWFFYTGRVVWRENVPVGEDERARVAEVAAAVSNGTLDIRSWAAPRRKV